MQLNIRIEKHSPRRHEGHEEKQKRLTFFWFPSSSLGMSKKKHSPRRHEGHEEKQKMVNVPLVPKLQLGNE